MWWCPYLTYFCQGRLKFKPYDIDQKFVPSLPFTGFVHKDFTDSEKLMGSKLTMKRFGKVLDGEDGFLSECPYFGSC